MPSLRISTAFLLGTMTVASAVTGVATAAEPKSLGQFKDWQAFEASDRGGKVCYAVSSPTKSEGKYSKRDPVLLMVARRPAERVYDEASAIAGYQYQKGSQPEFRVEKRRFVADGSGEIAWPRKNDNRKLVSAMRGGAVLKLFGTSARGTRTVDEFSLRGVTAALKAIARACPRK